MGQKHDTFNYYRKNIETTIILNFVDGIGEGGMDGSRLLILKILPILTLVAISFCYFSVEIIEIHTQASLIDEAQHA